MKTNVQVKDEPVEFQVNELLRLYGYNLTSQSSTKTSQTKSIINQEQEPSTCAWCQKLGVRSFTVRADNGDSKTLCSEVCFNQYRRASFKKNKSVESDVDHTTLPNIPTIKNKIEFNPSEKKTNANKCEHQLNETNRRKILLPLRRSIPTNSKTKTNGISEKSSSLSSSKRHRSSSSSSSSSPSNGKTFRVNQAPLVPSNLPVSLAWQPSLLLPSNFSWPPPPMDVNRFHCSLFAAPPPLHHRPPPPPPPPPPLLPTASSALPFISSDQSPSSLFTTLTKGTLTNFTCILPTFIPLPIPIPIPIPLCFPIQSSHFKYSVEVNHQQCQTLNDDDNIHQKQIRRLSI